MKTTGVRNHDRISPSCFLDDLTGVQASGPFVGNSMAHRPDWLALSNLPSHRQFNDSKSIFGNLFVCKQCGGTHELIMPSPPLDNLLIADLRFAVAFGQTEVAGFINNAFDKEYLTFQEAAMQPLGTTRSACVELRDNY